jgi:hypothetical protein
MRSTVFLIKQQTSKLLAWEYRKRKFRSKTLTSLVCCLCGEVYTTKGLVTDWVANPEPLEQEIATSE